MAELVIEGGLIALNGVAAALRNNRLARALFDMEGKKKIIHLLEKCVVGAEQYAVELAATGAGARTQAQDEQSKLRTR